MLKVATHNGAFHADDVFAIAALRMLGEPVEVIRTRDRELMDACDLRVDVGLGNDPRTGDFDHHQPGGAGARPNGVPYASFGLVWRHYGPRICAGDSEVADKVDQKLTQIVDAHDNGQTLFRSSVEGVLPNTIDRVIGLFNPTWDTAPEEEDYRRGFEQALIIAEQIIDRERQMAAGQVRAARRVRQAIRTASDPRLIVLDQHMPWRDVIVHDAPQAQFVVFPRPDGWALQAVPVKVGEFANRIDLPAAWAGKTDDELAEITGVKDAVFCHTGRFFAAARSREGILALARQALPR